MEVWRPPMLDNRGPPRLNTWGPVQLSAKLLLRTQIRSKSSPKEPKYDLTFHEFENPYNDPRCRQCCGVPDGLVHDTASSFGVNLSAA